jgi:hypothetical protein
MKKSTTQKRKHTLAIYPGDQIAVGTMYSTGAVRAEGERGLAARGESHSTNFFID